MNHDNMDRKSVFLDLVAQRRSIRSFLDNPVEREDIMRCIEAARLAPSAENAQPWRFLIIDDPDLKTRFAREVFSGIYSVTRFAAKAPVLILVLAQLQILTHRIGRQIQNIQFHLLDIGIAGEHIVLQAQDMGLGTCWLGWFNVRRARKFFRIPRKYKIVAMMALGYYDSPPSRWRRRKSLAEIAWFNKIKG